MFRYQIAADLELRLLEARHAALLFALTDRNRQDLRRWLPWLDYNTSVADTAAFIQRALQQFAANDGVQTGIWYHGNLVGVIGYHAINWPNRATSLGYWLGAEAQGRGIMTRACHALVEYAFSELGLNRVEIRCATQNSKSCAIPERLGFTHEGVARQAEWLYDHFVDHYIYAILAEDWSAHDPDKPTR